MLWKIVLVLGILGIILGFAVTAISAALPALTNNRTGWDEAMIGIIPGMLVLAVAFFITVVSLIFVFKKRKEKGIVR